MSVPGSSGVGYLSAASGLVRVGSLLYVIADDENTLGVFRIDGDAPGRVLRLFDGELPGDHEARKRAKPDLETLLFAPALTTHPHGVLLAFGSGSKPTRTRAVLIPLDGFGAPGADRRVVDLAPLMIAIEARVGRLNIEGGLLLDERFILLQRGNKGAGMNALITLDRREVYGALMAGDVVHALPFTVREYDLGVMNGVPLCFTDGAALADGRIVFTAVAEDTADAYVDGACSGSVVGILSPDGEIEDIERVTPAVKLEGVDVHLSHSRKTKGRIQLHLVTDADDATIASTLYTVDVPW